MKVLIITYYWPPAGGSGVQRWLYFVKYLRDFGIEPIVYTVENPAYPILDTSLEELVPAGVTVIGNKIWEPNSWFQKKNQVAAGFLPQKPTLSQKFIRYIRANYFIPDARKFWVKPSVKKLNQYLQTHPVDWIISTGPPHSLHLIGQRLHQKTGIKWLADFRDPWTDIDYFHQLPLTRKSLIKHQKLEKSVIQSATTVVVVSNEMQKAYAAFTDNCHVITNGYDGDIVSNPILDTPFTMTHIGMLNADRNPVFFWEVIRELLDSNEAFEEAVQINLVGKISDEVKQSIRQFDLEKYINYSNYVPHQTVYKLQRKSQVLLLFINRVPSAKGIVTGKFFEYLQAQRPILAIAPEEGDLAKIIKETQSGSLVGFDDKEALTNTIIALFTAYQSNNLTVNTVGIDKYHRKNLTGELAKLLKK